MYCTDTSVHVLRLPKFIILANDEIGDEPDSLEI